MQAECIPQAILGMDILCQAKSGMGKTAVFVLATLQQLEPVDGQVRVPIFRWSVKFCECLVKFCLLCDEICIHPLCIYRKITKQVFFVGACRLLVYIVRNVEFYTHRGEVGGAPYSGRRPYLSIKLNEGAIQVNSKHKRVHRRKNSGQHRLVGNEP